MDVSLDGTQVCYGLSVSILGTDFLCVNRPLVDTSGAEHHITMVGPLGFAWAWMLPNLPRRSLALWSGLALCSAPTACLPHPCRWSPRLMEGGTPAEISGASMSQLLTSIQSYTFRISLFNLAGVTIFSKVDLVGVPAGTSPLTQCAKISCNHPIWPL